MQNELFTNILILVAIFFLLFIIFNSFSLSTKKEGFEASSSTADSSANSIINGIAGNANYYSSSIKEKVIKLQDIMLLSKYRVDYENTIMALDDLVDNLMLQKVLSIKSDDPQKDLEELVQLNNSKSALNNVMKFIDTTSS